MKRIETSREIDYDRRRFLGAATMTIVSANISLVGFSNAQTNKVAAATINIANTAPHVARLTEAD